MYRDPRGGHNRKSIDENFFKSWSPQMAYVLGLIFADGAVEDVRRSSRTCYLALSSKDKSLLNQVKECLSSSHNLYERKPRLETFPYGRSYLCGKIYNLRIGNKAIFDDLVKLGLIPRKSLVMKFPKVPKNYLSYFIRGYFDGDGCVTFYTLKRQRALKVSVIFTSGSKNFLDTLAEKLALSIGINRKKVYTSEHAFQLFYKKRDSMQILNFLYSGLEHAPYLSRKHKIYKRILI